MMADQLSMHLTDITEAISTSLSAGITLLSSGNTKRALAHFNLAAEITNDLALKSPGVDASGLDLSASQKETQTIADPNLLQLCAEVHYYKALTLQELKHHSESLKSYKMCVDLSIRTENHSFAAMGTVGLAECYQELDDVGNQIRSWKSAHHLYRERGDVANEALMCVGLARAYLSTGQADVCEQYMRESKQLCLRVKDKYNRGELQAQYGWLYSTMRQFEEALVCFKQALCLLCRDTRAAASILQNIGAVYNEMELYPESLDYHQQAANLYEKLQRVSSKCKCLCNLAFAQSQLGDHHNAVKSYSHALAIAQGTRDQYIVFQACEGLGAVYFTMTECSEAEKFFKEALSVLDSIESDTGLARERVMEKLSCVTEAMKKEAIDVSMVATNSESISPTAKDECKSLNSVDADLTAYVTSYRHSSDEISKEPASSLPIPLRTKPSLITNTQEDYRAVNDPSLSPTTPHIKEGSLALGPDTRQQYTTRTLDGNTTSKAKVAIVSVDAENYSVSTQHTETQTVSKACIIL